MSPYQATEAYGRMVSSQGLIHGNTGRRSGKSIDVSLTHSLYQEACHRGRVTPSGLDVVCGATNNVASCCLDARFFPFESSYGYLQLFRRILTDYGLPISTCPHRHSGSKRDDNHCNLEAQLPEGHDANHFGWIFKGISMGGFYHFLAVQDAYWEPIWNVAGSSDTRVALFHTKNMEKANFLNSILFQRSKSNSREPLEPKEGIVEITMPSKSRSNVFSFAETF